MSHATRELASLEMAREVAKRIRAQPDLLDVARENLSRWSRLNTDTPSLLRCYVEWQAILELPLEQILDRLCAPTAEGARLRQNSPFAGVLTPREVWAIKSRHSSHAAAST